MQQKVKQVALALQGGGALGAFTWGVLEAFLLDKRIEITGFAGTSAGAMNALAAINGLIKNDRQGAIDSLNNFWLSASDVTFMSMPALYDYYGNMIGEPNLKTSPFFLSPYFSVLFNYLSPYIWNPYRVNYFKDFCKDFFDFNAIKKSKNPKLYLAATHIESGKIKIFNNSDVSLDVAMATTCLPRLTHAADVNGEFYWDGGLVANPPIYPLIYGHCAKDIVVIQLTKNNAPQIPKTATHIRHRFNEISLNSNLIREMRAIYLITKLIDEGKIKDKTIMRINLHVIKDDILFNELGAGSMLNMDKDFLHRLHNRGLKIGQEWIEKNFNSLGKKLPFSPAIYNDYIKD